MMEDATVLQFRQAITKGDWTLVSPVVLVLSSLSPLSPPSPLSPAPLLCAVCVRDKLRVWQADNVVSQLGLSRPESVVAIRLLIDEQRFLEALEMVLRSPRSSLSRRNELTAHMLV